MANSSLTLSSIDFDTLKNNFKQYLASQSVFKDYNFDGSNISVLLDVLSYNSYLNSFYLNMVASEMFLDSAQKYDSVISHAKELNYVPRSYKSSISDLSFNVTATGFTGQLIIEKGTKFTGTNANGSFVFTTDQLTTYTSPNNYFSVANLMVYEGTYFQDSYIVDYNIENQQYLISNKNVDLSSLTVTVVENNGANTTTFNRAETLFGLNDLSDIFFLQASQNNLYEVVFGDGLFGRKPLNGATIKIDYRICHGVDADGITSFVLDDPLGPVNGGLASVDTIVVNTPSNSGANQESLDSIKFSAPRYFATQQRAIAADDYAALVLSNFGGEISDVIVYGGETVEPKKYGTVLVCLKPAGGTIAPNYIKNQISNYLLDYIALPNRVELTDPDYLYVSVISYVQYDKTKTTKTLTEITSEVLDSITNYSKNNLELFGNDLRYSRLIRDIDNSDTSITSNQTELRLVKRISPLLNYSYSEDFDVNNVIYYEGQTVDTGVPHTELYLSTFDTHVEHASLISNRFTATLDGTNYELSYIADDGAGILKLYTSINGTITPVATVGSINYSAGTFSITNLLVNAYTNYISIYIRTRDVDIYANKNKIILIEPSDVTISVTETQR